MSGVALRVVACAVVAVMAAGCGGGRNRPAAESPSAPTSASSTLTGTPRPSPSPSPTATEKALSKAEMIDLAKRASLPADTLKEINAKPTDEPGLFEAVYLCGNSMEYRHVTYSRRWEDEAYVLVGRTHYYPANRASSVVSQVRSLHAACPHYSPDTDVTMVVLPELKLPGRSRGIDDSYAYCEDIRTANHKFICTAYFARGHLLSVVWAMNATLEDAQAVLQVVAPLAERSLLRV